MAGGADRQRVWADVFRIDLASVVRKYIGEPEKNLDRILRAADRANAILLGSRRVGLRFWARRSQP
jgi:hypothetical protein